MTKFLVLALLMSVATKPLAQNDESPANRRYLNDVFSSVKFTDGIEFANKVNDFGDRQEALKLRVFEPQGDSERTRPLLLLTPGGGFVAGDESWMNEFAEKISKAGYVVALNTYRLSESIETPGQYVKALGKAIEDQQDALNFLLDDAKKANRFGIDPTKIFIGGHSVGATTSMHTAYLDSDDSISPLMRQHFEHKGLLPEEKSRLQFSGVINLSGFLTDLSIIDRNDAPLLSLHGDRDSIIDIRGDENLFGSIAIHNYADTVGTDNEIQVIRGAQHNDTANSALCEECIPMIKRFMFNRLQPESEANQSPPTK